MRSDRSEVPQLIFVQTLVFALLMKGFDGPPVAANAQYSAGVPVRAVAYAITRRTIELLLFIRDNQALFLFVSFDSVQGYNTKEDIDRLLFALSKLL